MRVARLGVWVVGVVALAVGVALAYGAHRWRASTRAIREALEAARAPRARKVYTEDELIGLPAPVQRYFRTVLQEGQRLVWAVTLRQEGTFNMSERGENWKPFTAVHRVVTNRPGFDWEARVAMMPGLKVRVRDAYVAGEGILHAALFGLIPLVHVRGTPEVAEGELMRFFAETAWYPTALLPSQGVRWEAVDDASARATMRDGSTEVTLLFRFGPDGLIESVRAEGRGRMVKGGVEPTPWEGRWRTYEVREGMRVPLEGEVAWLFPEGPRPYWRGRIKGVQYEFVP